jgi:hypothetical protein
MANTKNCISDVTSSYTALGSMPSLSDFKSCSQAISENVSIEISGNDLIVSSSGSSDLDGSHPIGGTRISL